jgi:NHL repeat-containing protein
VQGVDHLILVMVKFNSPTGIAVESDDDIVVVDILNCRIQNLQAMVVSLQNGVYREINPVNSMVPLL